MNNSDDSERKVSLKDNAKVENILRNVARPDHAPPGATGQRNAPIVPPRKSPEGLQPKPNLPSLGLGSALRAQSPTPQQPDRPFKRLGEENKHASNERGNDASGQKRFKSLHDREAGQNRQQAPSADENGQRKFKSLHDRFNHHAKSRGGDREI